MQQLPAIRQQALPGIQSCLACGQCPARCICATRTVIKLCCLLL
jgi:hypothetical protein